MKKWLLSLLILAELMLPAVVFAGESEPYLKRRKAEYDELLSDEFYFAELGRDEYFSKNTLPAYYAYVRDYAYKLHKAFNDGRNWGRKENCLILLIKVSSDGTMTTPEYLFSDSKIFVGFGKKFKEFLEDNPPPPFYEGMDKSKPVYFEITGDTYDNQRPNYTEFSGHIGELSYGVYRFLIDLELLSRYKPKNKK